MSFILGTAPTIEEAMRIGAQNQFRLDDDQCVKTAAGCSRRQTLRKAYVVNFTNVNHHKEHHRLW